tara:strand:+ start:28 stop:201 length:174 start_codon:yes stop_codon:yes gene_type:complete
MSTHNNDEDLIIYKYLRKYLDKMIIEHNKMEDDVLPKVIRDIKEESIIDVLNELEGK